MKEFYARECGLDYDIMCYQDEIRQTVTKELLQEVTMLKIIKFEIDFENENIDYLYYNTAHECNLWDDISINEFIKKCYELDDCND